MKTLIVFLIMCTAAFSQEKEIKNNIFYGEILGNGGDIFFNYERVIFNNFSMRVGAGFIIEHFSSNSGSHTDLGLLPIAMLYYSIEISGNNNIELGAGALIGGPHNLLPTMAFGYRYSPSDGGFFISAAFDMFPNADGYLFPWGGVGIGTRF